MASTEPSTSLLRTGGRRGPESVPEVPPWETPPQHAHALTALRIVGARQGPGGARRTLGPGRGSPPPSPGRCRAQAQALGPDSRGRAAAGPSRSRAASRRLAASAPSLGEAGQDESRLPWGIAEVKRGAIHVNSVRRCRPSSATAPSGVTVNIAPREL